MKFKAMLLLSGTLALVACGQKNDTSDADLNADANLVVANDAAATGALAVAPLTAQGFANAAAASDRFEIESSKLAATSAQSAAVKDFATKMIAAHSESTAKLKATAGGLAPPVTPDDTLAADQQQKLDSLKGLTGGAFDNAYAAAQVEAHQKALDALNAYAASGDNAALKAFASELIPKVTAHLNMAKGLK
jgi:putative membrane protein